MTRAREHARTQTGRHRDIEHATNENNQFSFEINVIALFNCQYSRH